MKKTLFLILLLLSGGVVTAQEKLSKEEKERREKNVQAGNPFAKFGSKAPVATLSKGKYLEVHDLDSIVTIGTIRWHVENQKIVGRLIHDRNDTDAQPIGDATGRWMSPDPLSEEFPGYSPYNFVLNNPLRMVDPDGRASYDIIVNGSESKKFTQQLNSASNLNITRDNETGKLSATGIAKTKADKKLLQAINDKDITVKIDATSDNFKGNNVIFGGAFGGSEFKNGTIVATQVVNPIQAEIIEDLSGMSTGTISIHETLEAYLGALKSPGAGGFNSDIRSYEKAHKDAMKLAPNAKKVNTLNGFRVRASNENLTEDTATYTGVIWKGIDYRQLFIDENVPIKRE